MIDNQIKGRGIDDPRILDAFLKVERHLFVHKDSLDYSYEDHPLGIGYNQTISQPYIVAYMVDKLKITKKDRVLEIGTGSGYQTAILAELANEVYSLEILKPLQEQAKAVLNKLKYTNIFYSDHSGFEGWLDFAPYDKIIVSAAPRSLPQELINQLSDNGKMILPIGNSFSQALYLIEKNHEKIKKTKLDLVRFVPMISK